MDSIPIQYLSGETVKAGDRVQLAGIYGTVVFVSDGDIYEAAPGYETYAGSERGVIVCDDDGTLTSLDNPSEDLVLIDAA